MRLTELGKHCDGLACKLADNRRTSSQKDNLLLKWTCFCSFTWCVDDWKYSMFKINRAECTYKRYIVTYMCLLRVIKGARCNFLRAVNKKSALDERYSSLQELT